MGVSVLCIEQPNTSFFSLSNAPNLYYFQCESEAAAVDWIVALKVYAVQPVLQQEQAAAAAAAAAAVAGGSATVSRRSSVGAAAPIEIGTGFHHFRFSPSNIKFMVSL
jgi:hypothetical protein